VTQCCTGEEQWCGGGGWAGQGGALAAGELLGGVRRSSTADVDVIAGVGWLLARSGDAELVESGLQYLLTAVAADPLNPAARLYRAFTRWQQSDIAGARADLDAFDELEVQPPELLALADRQGLRAALSRWAGCMRVSRTARQPSNGL